MAYKTYSGSSFFSLDGVPFIVSEKWKAPKKVTLPLKFETGNPSEILFLEYDSTIEEALLARFEAEHEMEKAAAATCFIDESANSGGSEAANETGNRPDDFTKSSSNFDRAKKRVVGEQKVNFNPPVASRNAGFDKRTTSQNNAAYQVMNGNILVPTPISASGEAVAPEMGRNVHAFDIKDFENEQDPFENLSLKVINDIEELDKVFLATSKTRSDLNAAKEDKSFSAVNPGFVQREDSLTNGAVRSDTASDIDAGSFSKSMQEDTAAVTLITSSSSCVFNPYLLHRDRTSIGYHSTSEASSSRTPDQGWLPSTHLQKSQYSSESKIPVAILAGNLMSSVLPCRSEMQFGAQGHSSVQSVSKQMDFTNSQLPSGSVQPGHMWPASASDSTWPAATAKDFNLGPLPEVNQSQLPSNHCGVSSSSKASLRSFKSNPDLSAVDNGMNDSFGSFGRHTPPIPENRSHLPERKSTNPLPFANDVSSSTSSSQFFKDAYSPNDFKRLYAEDSRYSCLSHEAQVFVDFITAMGFPKMQTIQAVEKLGMDEKLVLDHLCALSKLVEKNYSAKDSENALFLFEGDLDKAEVFVKLAVTFRAMGFNEEKISSALVKCNLDEEKSLDLLTS